MPPQQVRVEEEADDLIGGYVLLDVGQDARPEGGGGLGIAAEGERREGVEL
jgi:hypothetical protein